MPTTWTEGTRPTTSWSAGTEPTNTYTEGTRPTTAWESPATEEDMTITNYSFAAGIDDNWATWAWKVYPQATWRWGTQDGSDGGECAVARMQSVGNKFRGQVYIAPVTGNQLVLNKRYNASVDFKIADNAIVTGRLQVYATGTLNETEDFTTTDGWEAVTITFTAPANEVRIYAYCLANDNNMIREPLRVDNFRIERYYQQTWDEGETPETGWMLGSRPSTDWSEG